jgi:dihydrofolate synthase / folylpolyglutamate synthase
VIVDSAHNPAGMAVSAAAVTEAFGFDPLVAVLAVSADKDVPGILAELEPAAASLVVTRNAAARSMDPGELEQLAAAVFGPDRVFAAPRLDDAIETATTLADEASGGLGGAGILITGSTTTAGEARVLLGAAGGVAGGRPGPGAGRIGEVTRCLQSPLSVAALARPSPNEEEARCLNAPWS